jgi:hypothetical protein
MIKWILTALFVLAAPKSLAWDLFQDNSPAQYGNYRGIVTYTECENSPANIWTHPLNSSESIFMYASKADCLRLSDAIYHAKEARSCANGVVRFVSEVELRASGKKSVTRLLAVEEVPDIACLRATRHF